MGIIISIETMNRNIRRLFRCFNQHGWECFPSEGDIIPVGWSIEQCEEENRTEVESFPLLVVGKTLDHSSHPDWSVEEGGRYGSVFRYLSTEGCFAAFVIARTEGGFAATTRPKKADKFGLPGGKLEAGESPIEAAIREAAEEGWKISGINPMPMQAWVVDRKLVLWFTATTAVRLSVYKEQGRITPVVISREMLLASGFGNGELKL